MKNKLKLIFFTLAIIGMFMLGSLIITDTVAHYKYEKNYSQLWELADKSSTIQAKQQYISQFVSALKIGKTNDMFADNDAIFLKTPNNSFESNLKAVETLSSRLMEIQNMDPKTFEYNTAIQQITAQEQGEAHKLIEIFYSCYKLSNYFIVWGWIGGFFITVSVLFTVVGLGGLMFEYLEGNF